MPTRVLIGRMIALVEHVLRVNNYDYLKRQIICIIGLHSCGVCEWLARGGWMVDFGAITNSAPPPTPRRPRGPTAGPGRPAHARRPENAKAVACRALLRLELVRCRWPAPEKP